MTDYEHAEAMRAQRAYNQLTAQYYRGNGMQPPVNWQERATDRATMMAAVSKHFPEWLDNERHRTAEALDTILHAIEGLREAVRQMNAALVEIRRQVSPDVVVVEFPSNALRHSR